MIGTLIAKRNAPQVLEAFNRRDLEIFLKDRTDAHSVENAIEYFMGVVNRRRAGERMADFQVERLDFRTSDPDGFAAGLERNGPKAVREFKAAFE
jgi:hypothetical protein